jgi:hypothetical protein
MYLAQDVLEITSAGFSMEEVTGYFAMAERRAH